MSQQRPYVSVVVPVYGVEPFIEYCLRSVTSQNYDGPVECILIDDCSPDRSMELARHFIRNYSGPVKFKTIAHEQNEGLSVARNTGKNCCEGDYIIFLDSDDELLPDCLLNLTGPLVNNVHDIVIGDFISNEPGKFENILKSPQGPIVGRRTVMNSKSRNGWYPMAVNKLYRRAFLERYSLNFKEGIIHEDELWSAEVACLAESIFIVKEQTYLYKLRHGSITSTSNIIERGRSLDIILEEFINFLDQFDLSDCFEANNILQSLFEKATWEMGRNYRDLLSMRYTSARGRTGILRKSCWKINGIHLKQQIRDFHYILPPKLGFSYYQLYSTLNDCLNRLKTWKLTKLRTGDPAAIS